MRSLTPRLLLPAALFIAAVASADAPEPSSPTIELDVVLEILKYSVPDTYLGDPARQKLPTFPSLHIAATPANACPPFKSETFCPALLSNTADVCDGETSCWETSYDKQRERMRDPRMRLLTFGHAQSYFDGLLSSDAFVQQCCRQDVACASRFRTTKLAVLTRSPTVTSSKAQFSVAAGEVQVAASTLTNAMTPETIEHMLLHELGHACQSARNPGHAALLDHACRKGDRALESIAFADIKAVMGKDVALCLETRLRQDAVDWKSTFPNMCYGSWLQEAFADAVFARWRTAPGHWAWLCGAVVDDMHAPTYTVMQCLADHSKSAPFCAKAAAPGS